MKKQKIFNRDYKKPQQLKGENMKKIQAWVRYKVEVEFELTDNATDKEIKECAEVEADEAWQNNAVVDDIEWYEN